MSSEEDARQRVAAERQRIWAAMQTWTEAAFGLDGGRPVVVEGAKHRPLAPFFDELHAMVFADEDDDHAGAEYPYEDGDVIVLGLRAELDRLRAVVRKLWAAWNDATLDDAEDHGLGLTRDENRLLDRVIRSRGALDESAETTDG